MLNNTKKIKELYEEIQRKIFYAIPVKWDELYLYASVIDRLGNIQSGEMYFYFMPKGIFNNKYVNVYEIPSKYDIEEEEYMKVVESLYNKIKQLRDEFVKSGQKVWSNVTISIKNSKFRVEYNYDNLIGGQEAYHDHHIYWRYKYLQIEPHGKKEKQSIENYLASRKTTKKRDEQYDVGFYKKMNTKMIQQIEKIESIEDQQETGKIKNQILCNKS